MKRREFLIGAATLAGVHQANAFGIGREGARGGFGHSGAVLGRASSIPGWVQSGAVVDADFFNQRVYPGPAFTDELADTRASDQYVPNADGSLVKKSSGVIPVSNAYMLIEPSRTNLLLRSREINDAGWLKRGSSGVTTGLSAVDSSTSAQKLLEDNGTSNHDIRRSISKAGSALAYSLSGYFYPEERTYIHLSLWDGGSGVQRQVFLLTGNGSNTLTPENGFTSASTSISKSASGWYRPVSMATSTTTTGMEIDFQMADQGNGNSNFYAGTTGSGMRMDFLQLEQAATPSSPIVTTTAAATRAANAVKVTRTGIARIVFTFDDDSTQEVTGINTGAQYTIPTNLNRRLIKRMTGYAS